MGHLSISQAWDETRAVMKRDGKLIGTVALALFVVPGMIANAIVPQTEVSGVMTSTGPWALVALVVGLISLVGQLAIIRMALGSHVTVGEAIAHGARRLLPYFASVLIWLFPLLIVGALLERGTEAKNAAAAIGLLVLTLAGIFLAVRLVLASAMAAAEPAGPMTILRRSWDLSKGHWWRLFALLAILVILAGVCLFATMALAGVLASLLFGGDVTPLSLGGLLVSVLTQLVTAMLAVLFFVMLARIYAQLAGSAAASVSVPSSGI